jgi:hypothetical protein
MASQSRTWWAVQAVGVKPDGDAGSYTEIHGLQSVGMNTNFNLQNFFEIGQAAIYESVEDLPDIEVTMEKVLDGYPLMYHLVTEGAPSNTLSGRSNVRTILALSVFGDTQDAASGTPLVTAHASGMYCNSVSYNFPVDGAFTENITLVGNNIIHKAGGTAGYGSTFAGTIFNNTDTPLAITGSGGINFREDLLFGNGNTRLPRQLPGLGASTSGWVVAGADGNYPVHVTNIGVSFDLNRENKNELGRKGPYARTVGFPVEITTEISIVSLSGVMIDATETGALAGGTNLQEEGIRVKAREGLDLYLGEKNKLQSWSRTGGDAGGGDAEITFTYVTYNTIVVEHPQDPTF